MVGGVGVWGGGGVWGGVCFFLMIRRPPRSTLDRSSAASDVYKRQIGGLPKLRSLSSAHVSISNGELGKIPGENLVDIHILCRTESVSYTHLRAHETVLDLVCRLLLEKKQPKRNRTPPCQNYYI
mgnify:CR=1 FL=1